MDWIVSAATAIHDTSENLLENRQAMLSLVGGIRGRSHPHFVGARRNVARGTRETGSGSGDGNNDRNEHGALHPASGSHLHCRGAPALPSAGVLLAAHAATSNREHDFDTIIVLQLKIIMPAARDDLTINLNGDPPIAQAHFLQQHRHRYRCPEAFFLTVE